MGKAVQKPVRRPVRKPARKVPRVVDAVPDPTFDPTPDLVAFHRMVVEESGRRFGRDDGGPVVEVSVVDRRFQERPRFVPLPLWDGATTDAERWRIVEAAAANFEVAYEEFRTRFRLYRIQRDRP